jgi:hypothetical protein
LSFASYACSTFGTKLCVQSTWPLWISASAASFDVAWTYSRHGDLRQPGLPVVRVLVQDVVLRRERAIRLNGPELTGFGFVNVDGSLTFDQTCFGTMNARLSVAEMNCESVVLSLITTVWAPLALIDAMLLSAPTRPDAIHRLVLATGGEAVDDVSGRERLAVRPLGLRRDVQRERLVAVAPSPAAREPRGRLAAAARHDGQRLVHGACTNALLGRPPAGVRVEVLREGRIARSGHDEALVRGRRAHGPAGRRGRGALLDEDRESGEPEAPRRASGCGSASHRCPFSPVARAIHGFRLP